MLKKIIALLILLDLVLIGAIYYEITKFDISTGFAVAPAIPNMESPRSFIHEIAPGTTIQDSILIENGPDSEKYIEIQGIDATLDNSKFTPDANEQKPEEVGTWISFDQNSIELEKKEEVILNFTIEVPENTPVGKYYGGISTTNVPTVEEGKSQVVSQVRMVSQVIITVTETPNELAKYTGGWDRDKTAQYMLMIVTTTVSALIVILLLQLYDPNKK